MPVLAGQQSKFAVLKIDDDSSSSEDEGKKLMAATGKSRSGGAKKKSNKSGGGAASAANGGGLLVHVVSQKPKQKGKKAKKANQPQVLDADGFIVQDAEEDYLERKFREDLREALKNSRESVSSSPPPPPQQLAASRAKASEPPPDKKASVVVARDPAEALIDDLDKQAEALINKASGAEKLRETQLMSFYRKRLLDTIRELNSKSEALTKANADVEKYRSRYKKICELLRDAEVNEKAHMAAELDKARRVETELSTQIGTLQGELMQAKSKIHELEVKVRELQDVKH